MKNLVDKIHSKLLSEKILKIDNVDKGWGNTSLDTEFQVLITKDDVQKYTGQLTNDQWNKLCNYLIDENIILCSIVESNSFKEVSEESYNIESIEIYDGSFEGQQIEIINNEFMLIIFQHSYYFDHLD